MLTFRAVKQSAKRMPDDRARGSGFMDVRQVRVFSVAGAVAAAAAILGGCAMDYQQLGSYYVAPGKYEYYRCRDLGPEIAAWTEREQDLTRTMQRSSEESSGTFVNAIVYSPELAIARESLRAAREEAARKSCNAQSLAVRRTATGSYYSAEDRTPAAQAAVPVPGPPGGVGTQPLPPPGQAR
jgi:hypothetical protein